MSDTVHCIGDNRTTIHAVETTARNHLLVKAVGKLGLQAVAARLGITEPLLRQYVVGIKVPDAIWTLAMDSKSGLIAEIINQPVATLPVSDPSGARAE
jgi:hypothetical protein